MSILNDIKGLFLPPVCPVCGGELHEGEGAFCMMCRTLAPQTGFWRRADNPLAVVRVGEREDDLSYERGGSI